MKTTFIILSLLVLRSVSAQIPSWTDFNGRKLHYPDNEYFTGFATNKILKGETSEQLLGRLKKSATANLTESVEVTVQSESALNTLEANNKLSEEYRQAITSFSRIDLSGLHTETCFDKDKKMGYALAYVKKDDLKNYYLNLVGQKKEKIVQKIKAAEQLVSESKEADALKAYYECMPLFREIDEAQAILILLTKSGEMLDEVNRLELQVKKAISDLYGSSQLSLDEVCTFLAEGLKTQTGKLDNTIQLANFTYQDTKMGSPFSRRFMNAFEKELIGEAGYKIISGTDLSRTPHLLPEYLVTGTYWEEGANIRIITILRNISNSKPLASADGLLPKKWLTDNDISCKPENYQEALESMKAFKKEEVVNGGLMLDVWTNKGDDNPIFVENDTLRFTLRVDNECYVRIINHFADGSKVLLVDNMYIGSDKVNKVVTIPKQFQCASPFGVETLQVNCQTKEFSPLQTRNQGGYDFIVSDLASILKNTRGFKPLTNEDLMAEKRIVVTTMKE